VNRSREQYILAGGVTGGHLFPGLALAEQLERLAPSARITFAGSGNALERRFVGRAGYDYAAVLSNAPARGPWRALRFVADQMAAYHVAARMLKRCAPTAVVGLGGAASLPMARAALHQAVPLVLLEQNVIPGRATRWLAPGASLICTAYDETRELLRANGPVRTTGIPLRGQFGSVETRADGRRPSRRLLVIGGSQGASSLNEAVPRALHKVRDELTGWTIIHQAGRGKQAEACRLYEKLALPARVVPFIDNMAEVTAKSDLVISRAGGSALAELAALGRPAVLVPYPHARDDHQHANAVWYAHRRAACVVDSRVVPGRLDDQLAEVLAGLLIDPDRLQWMSAAMRRLARPDAAWSVAQMIVDPASRIGFRAA